MLLEHSRKTRMLVGFFSSTPKRTSKLLHPSPLCGKLKEKGGGGGGDECTGNRPVLQPQWWVNAESLQ